MHVTSDITKQIIANRQSHCLQSHLWCMFVSNLFVMLWIYRMSMWGEDWSWLQAKAIFL